MPHDEHEHEHEHSDHNRSHPHALEHDRGVDQGSHQGWGPELVRGEGLGSILFLDCFSGIAGDMLVAALVDLGVPSALIERSVAGLHLPCETRFVLREKHQLAALGFEVVTQGHQRSRDYQAIQSLLAAAEIQASARDLALRAFTVLAEAEASAHGVALEHVHFHEVGAIDSIVDIVASAVALDHIGAEVVCSPLPIGRGFVRAAHGPLPLPAPGTLGCLRGVPTYDAGIDGELVTPTGACLVKAAARSFARWPAVTPSRIGLGAGTRDLPDRPNVLRAVLGRATPGSSESPGVEQGSHVLVELNVDDMTGELAAFALSRALEAGAVDAWFTPIGMKKGRPATMLSALAPATAYRDVAHAFLRETTSLGVRIREVGRVERPRTIVEVETEFGTIPIKVAGGDGLPTNAAPEHDACLRAAEQHRVPLKQVYAAAAAAWLRGQPASSIRGG